MIRRGLPDEAIEAVISAHPNGVGAKHADRNEARPCELLWTTL
jgi:hypothetical protein